MTAALRHSPEMYQDKPWSVPAYQCQDWVSVTFPHENQVEVSKINGDIKDIKLFPTMVCSIFQEVQNTHVGTTEIEIYDIKYA